MEVDADGDKPNTTTETRREDLPHDDSQTTLDEAQSENAEKDDKAELNCPTTSTVDESKMEDGSNEQLRGRPAEAQKKKADAGTHRAGFDAYMTAYIFAFSCALSKKENSEGGENKKEQSWLPACLNKVYLSGKAAPLNVVKSTFAKSSKAHLEKMEMVWGGSM